MIEKIFIHFKNKQDFLVEKDNIYDSSIVFIQDTQQIYTHGTYYNGDTGLLIQETTSDANGLVNIPVVEGYQYIGGHAYYTSSDQPLMLIRFGNYIYSGYYGGASDPSPDTPITVLFTSIGNCTVKLIYIKNDKRILVFN